MPTPRALVDAARIRHPAFTEGAQSDGALVLFLNQRQRTLLAQYGASIEGIVTRSVQIAVPVDGQLVEASETPTLVDTTEPGYAVHVDPSTQELYVETDDPRIIARPFGVDGGAAIGIPLPNDFVRFTSVALVLGGSQLVPVEVVEETQRTERRRNAAMFVNRNRLVPCRALEDGNTGDIWTRVTAVQFSYIPIQTFTTMDDDVTLPVALQEALTAGLANMMARHSRHLTAAERRAFLEEERLAEAQLDEAALDMVRGENSVAFRS